MDEYQEIKSNMIRLIGMDEEELKKEGLDKSTLISTYREWKIYVGRVLHEDMEFAKLMGIDKFKEELELNKDLFKEEVQEYMQKVDRLKNQKQLIRFGTYADRVLKALKASEDIVRKESDINESEEEIVLQKMFDIFLSMGLAHNGIEDEGECADTYETLESLNSHHDPIDAMYSITFDFRIDVGIEGDDNVFGITFCSRGFQNIESFRENIYLYYFRDDFEYDFEEERDLTTLGDIQNTIEIVEKIVKNRI